MPKKENSDKIKGRMSKIPGCRGNREVIGKDGKDYMKKESAAVKKDDMVFHRILILFLVSFAIEIGFLFLNRLYLHAGTFMTAHAIVEVLQYLAIFVCMAGVGLAAVLWRKGRARYGVFAAVGGALAFAACRFMEFFYPHGAKYLSYMVPLVLVLGLVYYIYQKEFLVSAVVGILVLMDLWAVRKVAGNLKWMGVLWGLAVGIGVLLVLCAVFAWRLSKTYGRTRLFGKPLVLLSKNTKYPPIYASCVMGAVSVFAALLLGVTAAYYLMFLIGAYLLVLAVYYTTKLM